MDLGPLQRVRRGLDRVYARVRRDIADLGLETTPSVSAPASPQRPGTTPASGRKKRRSKHGAETTVTTIRDSGFSPSTADLEANVDGTRPRRASASGREGGAQGDGGEQDAEEEEPQPAPIPWHVPQPTDPPFLQTQPECRLARLPPEVQLSIFRKLNFGDLERLRRTSQYYRAFLRPEVVAYLHGGPVGLKGAILAHCCRCLAHDPYLNGILLADHSSKDFPLSARCLDCAAQAGEMQVGTKVTLGNFSQAWICRWCGYPIKGTSSYHHAQFHRDCYNKYNDVLLAFFVLGWLQLAIGIVAAALSWRYFRGVVMVFAPTVTSFILLWFCIALLLLRGNIIRTFHWAFVLELIIAGLWIPPVYTLSRMIAEDGSDTLRTTVVTLSFFCLNILFRLVNIMGNVVLTCEYDVTKHHIPHPPLFRRLVNPLMAGLIFWTYPQAVERKFPPEWQ